MELTNVACCHVLWAFIFISVITIGSCVPYGFGLDDYNPVDSDESLTSFEELPVKRGMCRPGFTYHSVLRNCLPSLSILRGKGRHGGRRGRREMSWRKF